MSRTLFLLVVGLLGFVYSGILLLVPTSFAQNAGFSNIPEAALLLRAVGGMIFSVSLANLLVRTHPDSPTLSAILLMNVAVHGLAAAVGLIGVAQGLITLRHAIPGLAVHILIAIGALIYASRMAKT